VSEPDIRNAAEAVAYLKTLHSLVTYLGISDGNMAEGSMRSKEVANDYRYFPEPDLLPIVIDDAYIETIRNSLPELPAQKRQRFTQQYKLSSYDANVLCDSRALADYFEAVVADCDDAKIAANWVQVELMGQLNRSDMGIDDSPVSAAHLGGLIRRILDNSISGKIAKQVFEAMWQGEGSADEIIEARGLRQVSDSGALEGMVDEVISGNATQVAQYLAADEARRKKLVGFFVGQVMKLSKGQANPQMVNQLLAKKLQ
jgi:aspartyl-tRNA(Asn)/glutamyl-tRNA(Gln) amidotransferase subunit B